MSQLGKTPLQHAAFANTKLVPGSLECCGIRDGMGPHERPRHNKHGAEEFAKETDTGKIISPLF